MEDCSISGVQEFSRWYPAQGGQLQRHVCVTFSLYYTLLRLLNPDRTYQEIVAHMLSVEVRTLRIMVLRLNKFVIDALKTHTRNELLRTRREAGPC